MIPGSAEHTKDRDQSEMIGRYLMIGLGIIAFYAYHNVANAVIDALKPDDNGFDGWAVRAPETILAGLVVFYTIGALVIMPRSARIVDPFNQIK